ncbi:tRNA dihydrouridine(16) synthase DusC, partial [Candidatus Shapirobacteria bacterium CG10_big_fil_rev_8_21_14_0_10_38_8]
MIFMAPMEGVVDSVTRALYSRIGGFDRFVTEFVRVTDRCLPDALFLKYCPELKTGGTTAEGIPVFIQLLGGNPSMIAENAIRAVALGAPGIDLNFGCPAPTVNRHDGGATLLKNPHRLYDVISSVRTALPLEVPVTAKIRLGFSNKDLVLDIARAVDEAGASMLTVHARTRDEGYRPPAHWEYIAKIRESIKTPVVANGDIWSVEDYIKCREVSGCADVALGRGAMATPDLALQIRAYIAGDSYEKYQLDQTKQLLLDYIHSYRSHGLDPMKILGRSKQWLRFLSQGYP